MRHLDAGERVVDLSADFRLRSAESRGTESIIRRRSFLRRSGRRLHRAEMASARLVSGVGCNATSAITAAREAGLIEEARISAASAPPGGSQPPRLGARCAAALRVSTFVHRHMAEVVQELSLAQAPSRWASPPSSWCAASVYLPM
ncbi:MAG: hypothetical protein ACLUEQ_03290 [Cloacibacillus evryensis]